MNGTIVLHGEARGTPGTWVGQHGPVETTTPPTASAKDHPGWVFLFHGVVVLAAAGFLYSLSFPGIAYFLAAATSVALLGLAIAWLVQLVMFCAARRRGQGAGRGLRFVIAPVVGALVVVSAWTGAPLYLRWAASRSSFDHAVKASQNGGTPDRGLFGRIGLYRISRIKAVPNGLLFYEATGDLFDDAGFAYLPAGPSPALANGSFENPQWRALGNDWYAWTASW